MTGQSPSFPGLTPASQAKLVASLLVVAALVVARRVALRVVERRIQDPTLLYKWSKGTSYAAFVAGLLLVTQIWFVAIGLKDIVADLAGWIFILWRRPFDIGDRVQIGPHSGDVVDIRIFQFTIMEIGNWVAADQSTGRPCPPASDDRRYGAGGVADLGPALSRWMRHVPSAPFCQRMK